MVRSIRRRYLPVVRDSVLMNGGNWIGFNWNKYFFLCVVKGVKSIGLWFNCNSGWQGDRCSRSPECLLDSFILLDVYRVSCIVTNWKNHNYWWTSGSKNVFPYTKIQIFVPYHSLNKERIWIWTYHILNNERIWIWKYIVTKRLTHQPKLCEL